MRVHAYLAAVAAGAIVGFSSFGFAQQQATTKFCIGSVAYSGSLQGYPQHTFAIRVADVSASNAAWIVAEDANGGVWPQGAGYLEAKKGKVFGLRRLTVSSISTYPLSFYLVNVDDASVAKEIREIVRNGSSYSPGELKPLTSTESCLVDLQDEKPVLPETCKCR